jgi:oligopeptide transport system permease protein
MFFKDSTDGHMHIFGTDTLGRDIFTRTWSGGRVSLFIAFAAVFINFVVGIIYGGISGYLGGAVDNVMMRIIEIINGIPYLIIVVLLMMVIPPGAMTMVIAYATVGWTGMARLVRGQIMSLKQQDYIVAAKVMGARPARIIAKHLLPNTLSVVIVNITLAIPSAIFTEAFLSYIGLGVPVPMASWGVLANDGSRVFQMFPSQLIIPAICISLTMLSFNLLGDGLRDALDPKLRR